LEAEKESKKKGFTKKLSNAQNPGASVELEPVKNSPANPRKHSESATTQKLGSMVTEAFSNM
jgi:hypothetical protein